jgi:hypothetical protein
VRVVKAEERLWLVNSIGSPTVYVLIKKKKGLLQLLMCPIESVKKLFK